MVHQISLFSLSKCEVIWGKGGFFKTSYGLHTRKIQPHQGHALWREKTNPRAKKPPLQCTHGTKNNLFLEPAGHLGQQGGMKQGGRGQTRVPPTRGKV